jgi:DNA-binding response OmpR family regulator
MYKTSSNNNEISNNNHHRHQSTDSALQNQNTSTPTADIIYTKQKTRSSKGRILIVDDDPDIGSTFSIGLQDEGFQVYTYNDPLEALVNFKPDFYDVLLIDINMPTMNGFELCTKLLKLDINVRICFITAGEANIEALREVYPTISVGCFIKKPVRIDQLVKRVKAELE